MSAPADLSYDAFLARAQVPRGHAAPPDPQGDPGSQGRIPAHFIVDAVIANTGAQIAISQLFVAGLTVQGDLHLENFTIPFPLVFKGCHFLDNLHVWRLRARTLSLEGSRVDGGIELRGSQFDAHLLLRDHFHAQGPVIARDVKVADTLDLSDSVFAYGPGQPFHGGADTESIRKMADGEAFGFSRGTANTLFWRNVRFPGGGEVTLRDAEIKTSLRHDFRADPQLQSWPRKGLLVLDGLRYRRMDDCDAKTALRWLDRQANFTSSSYAALAGAFETMGKPQEAEDVLAEMKRGEIAQIRSPLKRWILTIVYSLIGYGQRPTIALLVVALFFALHLSAIGWLHGHDRMYPSNGLLTQACFYGPEETCKKLSYMKWRGIPYSGEKRFLPPDYPDMNPLAYSVESFLPIFDLGQRNYWEPPDALKLPLAALAWLGIFVGGIFTGAIAGLLTPRKRAG